MFIVVQLPLADLRSLTADGCGRLKVPDWKADDPGEGFIRGFGKMASRNSTGYGLLGERAFADFNQAVRFKGELHYRQDGWPGSLLLRPWFRRLYFDGELAGRFEFGFLIEDEDEERALGGPKSSPIDLGKLAQAVHETELTVRSVDGSEEIVSIERCGRSLALAYIAATTKHDALHSFPVAETYGKTVMLGRPTLHIRLLTERSIATIRDRRLVRTDGEADLFITSSEGSSVRNSVIVQMSPHPAMQESPAERAVRVLFSHLNAVIFAHAHFMKVNESAGLSAKRSVLKAATKRMIDRFGNFSSTAPQADSDELFSAAVKAFAAAYVGRLDELAEKLGTLAEQFNTPTATERAKDYAQSIFELIVTTAVKTTVEGAAKGLGKG